MPEYQNRITRVTMKKSEAPWEVTSKADVYETYRGYKAFLIGE